MTEGAVLKKLTEAMKDLVTEANFDCSTTGISLQAMDSSHVSLVALLLRADGFDHFRCDRNISLGINLGSMGKVLKCCNNGDIVTLKADDNADAMTFMFENQSADRISDFELKLMDIDSEHLGIPDTEYTAVIKMPSAEFQRIPRDLQIKTRSRSVQQGRREVRDGRPGSGTMIRQSSNADKPEKAVTIDWRSQTQSFAMGYLSQFCKATPLASSVT